MTERLFTRIGDGARVVEQARGVLYRFVRYESFVAARAACE